MTYTIEQVRDFPTVATRCFSLWESTAAIAGIKQDFPGCVMWVADKRQDQRTGETILKVEVRKPL